MKFRLLIPAGFLLLCSCDEGTRRPSPGEEEPHATLSPKAEGFSGRNAYIHCARLCALGPRPTGSAAYTRQISYLAEQLRIAGWEVRTQPFSLSNGAGMVNLHAFFGSPERPRPLLISCHIDTKSGIHGFVGADDGASGAALLLELSRCLAAAPEQAAQVELVFFDGEEAFGRRMTETDGLYGSRYDVMRRRGKLPRWQINLDMLGGRNKTVAVPLLDSSPALLEHYERAVDELHLPAEKWLIYPGSYLDDHRPFAEAGVETLNLICAFSRENWWHTEQDNMSRISSASLEESGRVVMQILRRLTESEPLSTDDAASPAGTSAEHSTAPAYPEEP